MTYLILLCLFNGLQSFFGGVECSFISLQLPRVRSGVKGGGRRASLILDKLNNLQLVLSTTLVGTNISIVLSSLMAVKFVKYCGFEGKFVSLITTITMTFVILIFDIIPKNWARQAPYKRTLILIYPYCFFGWLLYLPSVLISRFATWFVNLVSKQKNSHSQLFLRNDFRFLLRDSEAAKTISSKEVAILDKSVDFFRLEAKDILVPLEKVVTVKSNVLVKDALAICREKNYARLPVVNKNNEIIGVFSLYEVMNIVENTIIQSLRVYDILRQVYYISEKLQVQEIIGASRDNNSPLLLVKNEDSRVVGIVTAEDVIKSIFSE